MCGGWQVEVGFWEGRQDDNGFDLNGGGNLWVGKARQSLRQARDGWEKGKD